MNLYLSSILAVLIISVIPLFGLLVLVLKKSVLERDVHLLVSFAVGALLGNSLIHILPEVFESGLDPLHMSLSTIFGIFLFYSLEQFLRWRHCHEQTSKEHIHPVGVMSLVGDTLHNFIDGILIASSFIVSPLLGWSTALAVIFHEIPQEIADFSVLFYAKWSIKKILIANIVSALFAFVGLAVGFWINSGFEGFSNYAIAVTAGGFIYIACTDLIPDIHANGGNTVKERIFQLFAMLLGILVFLVV